MRGDFWQGCRRRCRRAMFNHIICVRDMTERGVAVVVVAKAKAVCRR